jgi:hypothetical protein
VYEPSMSAGLSRSIRSIRPVESARMRTLLATSAATKSEAIENCNATRSMLNMGSDTSWSWRLLVLGGAYPLEVSNAMLRSRLELFCGSDHDISVKVQLRI